MGGAGAATGAALLPGAVTSNWTPTRYVTCARAALSGHARATAQGAAATQAAPAGSHTGDAHRGPPSCMSMDASLPAPDPPIHKEVQVGEGEAASGPRTLPWLFRTCEMCRWFMKGAPSYR